MEEVLVEEGDTMLQEVVEGDNQEVLAWGQVANVSAQIVEKELLIKLVIPVIKYPAQNVELQ